MPEPPSLNSLVQRQIVLVSGAPASGKTTLAVPLAAHLGLPLIAKDDIKETLFDALSGPAGDRAWLRQVGSAAMEVLWRMAERSPSAVLEANFRPHSKYERDRLIRLEAQLIEIYCQAPADLIRTRFRERAQTAHPAHVLPEIPDELLAEFDQPMGLGALIQVDTTNPVDVQELAARVRVFWQATAAD